MNLKIKIIILILSAFVVFGCSTKYPNKNPEGSKFPSISGETLEYIATRLPDIFADKEVVLLLGYVQNSQFDIDRWLIGLDMTQTDVGVYELPTIQGMFPKFFKTQINNGMRKGIPKELWKGVITIYDGGELVQQFTGNVNPNNARVILLDKNGIVRHFYDRGFSVAALKELREKLESL
ncbi:MAG: hypothetical protein OQK04_02075 [Kangiellaceae bacterium]|nr:hypothetical protein [Kangiellaceae bacterium]MCW8997489.1 hypothetical protein [Kangiellaceae bacterium]